MPDRIAPRTIEDGFRAAAYSIGAAWALVFVSFTPSTYTTVVSHVFIFIWSLLVLLGMLTAAVGSLTRRDTQVELSGLYVALLGLVLYLVAQSGFLGTAPFHDRIAFVVFILFHISLVLPRVAGLESYRRAVHRAKKS